MDWRFKAAENRTTEVGDTGGLWSMHIAEPLVFDFSTGINRLEKLRCSCVHVQILIRGRLLGNEQKDLKIVCG